MELLTTKQVAEMTNYSVVSIQRFVKKGVLKALRMPEGRKYMFEKEAVINVLKQRDNGKNQIGL